MELEMIVIIIALSNFVGFFFGGIYGYYVGKRS